MKNNPYGGSTVFYKESVIIKYVWVCRQDQGFTRLPIRRAEPLIVSIINKGVKKVREFVFFLSESVLDIRCQ